MFKNSIELAQSMQAPLVVFDIEHTGGKKEVRGITEYAAKIVHPSGDITDYASLVDPGAHVEFNRYVSKITGITPATVKGAPTWAEVAHAALVPYQSAIWVGFNSRSADIPVILEECQRGEVNFTAPEKHLDLYRLSPLEGGLGEQVSTLLPGLDTSGAHRAAKDVLMTLHLLEALLPRLNRAHVLQALKPAPDPKAGPSKRTRPLKEESESTFLVNSADARLGASWSRQEVEWIKAAYANGQTLEALAVCVGRRARGLAFVLDRIGLLPSAEKRKYNVY